MKFSVIIPAYNAATTIRATLDSVLAQTLSPYEILVCDDGSTDDTSRIVASYNKDVKLYNHPNHGVAYTLNFLCEQAKGDMVAILAADDVWHPRYLELQENCILTCPSAVAFFTEHINLYGYGNYTWERDYEKLDVTSELIDPVDFISIYDRNPMSFQWSCGCIHKRTLAEIGPEPFLISGAEDTYLHNLLPLLGPILYTPIPLVAYRVTSGSLSSKLLINSIRITEVFKLLDDKYKNCATKRLYRQFRRAFASRRRQCGKFLMGAAREGEARNQFYRSLITSIDARSVTKSLGLLLLSYMPKCLQPKWPSSSRI